MQKVEPDAQTTLGNARAAYSAVSHSAAVASDESPNRVKVEVHSLA